MFDFSTVVDRHGTGVPSGIMSLTVLAQPTCCPSPSLIWISPPPLHYRCAAPANKPRGVWLQSLENEEFLAAVAHWFRQRFNSQIDTETVVYGPSVIYMVSELIRLWSSPATAWWSILRLTMPL